MKRLIWFTGFYLQAACIFSQKPSLDFTVIKQWPQITGEQISSDGMWVIYGIGLPGRPDSLILCRTDKKVQLKMEPADNFTFTDDSRYLVYFKAKRLALYDLQKADWALHADSIQSFKTPAASGTWLAYLQTNGRLLIRNLKSGKQRSLDQVSNYQFSDNGKVLLIQQKSTREAIISFRWLDLENNTIITVAERCKQVGSLVFDNAATQLAFLAEEEAGGKVNTFLRYYKRNMDSSIILVNNDSKGMEQYNLAAGVMKFSSGGQRLFFRVKPVIEKAGKPSVITTDLNVWHYDDDYISTEQLAQLDYAKNRTYTAALNIFDGRIIRMDTAPDDPPLDFAKTVGGDYALIKRRSNAFAKWKQSNTPRYDIVDLQTGERTTVVAQKNIADIHLSPGCKYVLWYDSDSDACYRYEISTGITKNITPHFPVPLRPAYAAISLRPFLPCGVAGWTDDERNILLYDEFDIWRVDVTGSKAPVNVTNGYGRKHNTVLRIWNGRYGDYDDPVIKPDELLLAAFDKGNKENGFFRMNLRKRGDPVKLTQGPYLYYAHKRFNAQLLVSGDIQKAGSTEMYLLSRMNSDECPNLYITRDFINFTAISNLYPEKNYNWLTTELVTWTQDDGTVLQGVLYKPENFDPNRKYPLIFYFYEKLSQRLHQYLAPGLGNGSINIPLYVSNGYLVFTPDIDYHEGSPGDDACGAVVSAARYLSGLPYVDSTKMGLQGHSYGGYEVNYIVSHSNLFAAAQESSGASDFISYYNGFYRENSAQFYFETGQGRIGATLWEKPELFIKNSPIFLAEKVQTPLLIMHNKDDGEVPFQQGVEWFTALRRLGKKVWMLQYDRETHAINQPKNKLDFDTRVKQFFDHYLNGVPPPRWMTAGIPAMYKEIESGLETD